MFPACAEKRWMIQTLLCVWSLHLFIKSRKCQQHADAHIFLSHRSKIAHSIIMRITIRSTAFKIVFKMASLKGKSTVINQLKLGSF